MSKRLKYAKLRLAKPNDADDALVPAEATECKDSTLVDKTSKYFDKGVENACTNDETFILIHSEDFGEDNETAQEQSSRRRTQKPPKVCPDDGPKFPKLKKANESNRLISNFLSSQTNQMPEKDDDFEESKFGSGSQSKQTKVQRITKKITKARKRTKKQSDIRNVFKKYKNEHAELHELLKQHSASEQIDAEQLQIALTMSRSLVNQECDQMSTKNREYLDKDCFAESCSGPSEDRRIVSIRTTLEQFGFRCKNSYTDYDLNVIFGSAPTKNVKKIKHKRATNLQPRSKEELAAFIDSQEKKLFRWGTIERITPAESLQNSESIQSQLSNHFWIAQTEQSSDQLMDKYYVPELLQANPAPVGCMLKDWSKIPGRESTPDRGNEAPISNIWTQLNSPDLFNDCEIVNKAPECDSIEIISLHQIAAENTVQHECVMQKEQESQEVLVTSNESDYIKMNATATDKTSDTIMRVVKEYNTATREIDRIPVEDNSREIQEVDVHKAISKANFVTVPELSHWPQPAFHHSSENIFDDTDPNPIVSFEVYSSEEEKISAASRVGMIASNGDNGTADIEGGKKSITLNQNYYDGLQNGEKNGIPSKTGEHCTNSFAIERHFSFEKDHSFHRLAIKARLSEALNGETIPTVKLLEESSDSDKSISNLSELIVNLPTESQCSHPNITQDDVIYISDYEVNDLIRCESIEVLAPSDLESEENQMENTSKDDPDMTIPYDVAKTIKEPRGNGYILSFKPECQSPTEEATGVAENNCPDSTFAYLDKLVRDFNLPPLKSQQNMHNYNPNQHASIERTVTDEIERGIRKTEFCQDAPAIKQHVSKISEALSTFIYNHEDPKIDDHEIIGKIIVPQSPSNASILSAGFGTTSFKELSKIKSCTQFDSTSVCLTTIGTVSETLIPSSSTPDATDGSNQSNNNKFVHKFDQLQSVELDEYRTEFVISTLYVYQKPPSYEDMPTPEIERELFKYGLKAMQRTKAVRVLHHLFHVMHPYVMLVKRHNIEINREDSCCQAKDINEKHQPHGTPYTSAVLKAHQQCAFKLDVVNTHYFLPSKPRKKMAGCAVPLHISFFNLVSENKTLQRQILRYEPINLEEIYELLKDAGSRYEVNDLIAFLDKYCITFRTAPYNGARMAKMKSTDSIN